MHPSSVGVASAAERLHVSQPPVSRQIRDLESELNVTLLERTPASVRLTKAGRVLLALARKLLLDADQLRVATQAAAASAQEDLHIGYAPSPTAEILPQILCRFQELAPKARVTFHDLGQTGMIAGLRSRSLHAALTLRPPAGEVRGLKFDTIRSYRHGIICAAGSPWDGMASLNPATLLDILLVGYQMEDIAEYYKLISKCLGISETSLRIRQQCDGVVSLIAAVESGLGPAVVGEFIKPVAGNRVRFVPFPARTLKAEVGILYRQSGLSDRGKVFVEACRLSS